MHSIYICVYLSVCRSVFVFCKCVAKGWTSFLGLNQFVNLRICLHSHILTCLRVRVSSCVLRPSRWSHWNHWKRWFILAFYTVDDPSAQVHAARVPAGRAPGRRRGPPPRGPSRRRPHLRARAPGHTPFRSPGSLLDKNPSETTGCPELQKGGSLLAVGVDPPPSPLLSAPTRSGSGSPGSQPDKM